VLHIIHPPAYKAERLYIYDLLLGEFLGLEYQLQERLCDGVKITLKDDPHKKELCLSDHFFKTPENEWLTADSLPKQPLRIWDISTAPIDATVISTAIPVLYGDRLASGSFYEETPSTIDLGLDIFGSAFFMLTRYEELVVEERDTRERFPATASIAYKEGFLTRPLVNEYLEILCWALKRLWPSLERKQRRFRVRLTHDVDWPYSSSQKPIRPFISAAADIVKRKEPMLAVRRIWAFPYALRGNFDYDVNNTFEFIMSTSEQHNIRSTFYVITEHSAGLIDGIYSIEEPWIKKLLRRFNEREHKIGLHTSYNTFRDPDQVRLEYEKLLATCEEVGVHQANWGARQHFLRWENPITWQNLEDTGIDYDSTLTFADQAGFRCGICYEYPVFNVYTRKILKLRERPLIVMEGTLLDYMELSLEVASQHIFDLQDRCKLFGGDFTLLWHNSSLISRRERNLYQDIVNRIAT